MLDAALRNPAVWIAAPAGAGKTSLVTSYLAVRRIKALWYNVDGRDADVVNIFQYLDTAARFASPRKTWGLPAFDAASQADPAVFARHFFETLYQKLPDGSVVVLDDYHEAKAALCDEVIREAIAALPKGISFIVVSRNDPPPSLARHIAARDMALVGPEDLRLTEEEMSGLVRLYRPDLGRAELAVVTPRVRELADGWAAIATLLLLNRRVGALDAEVAESTPRVFAYFATEILDRLPPKQREFLLATSVVPSITAELALELTGDREAARILADLERSSFLTQRLGNSGAFRYHPLWRDFLCRRAESDIGSEALRDLHRRAARWLVRTDQIEEAMDQFEAAEDLDQATGLFLEAAPAYLAAGKNHTVATWIDRLTASGLEAKSWVLYWDAMSRLGHDPTGARERFERAFVQFMGEKDAAGVYAACAGAMQAIVHEGVDFARLEAWVERLEALETSGPPCPEAVLPTCLTGRLMFAIFRGSDPAQNRRWVELAMQAALSSNDVGYRVMTGGLAALILIPEGSVQGRATVEMLREAARARGSPALAALTLLVAESFCAWTTGDKDACLRLVREALVIASRSGVFVKNDYLYSLAATAVLCAEDVDGAPEFLEPLRQMAGRGLFANASYQSYAAWEALLRNDTTRALECAELSRTATDALGYPFARAVSRLAMAQVLTASGRKGDALSALHDGRRIAVQIEDFMTIYACELVEADILWDDDRTRAVAALRRGFAIARERSIYNTYWLRASMAARLAQRALEHDIEPDHVRALIARRGLRPASIPARVEGWLWRYRVRALGSFEIIFADVDRAASSTREVSCGLRGKPLRLLQAVLAFGARGVRDTQLVDALWPDAEGDAGRRVFDTTLHRLRRQLGDDDLVQLTDGRVYLDERLCWVDLWALDHAIVEVDRQVGRGAPPTVLTELARRLEGLYRGPLLGEDIADQEWVRAPRERISARYRRAVEGLAKALRDAGQFADAATLQQR
jgi:ATP/maltotriose-dependent transcriptional regulator MalT